MAKSCKPCTSKNPFFWMIPVFVVFAIIATKKARDSHREDVRSPRLSEQSINVDDVTDDMDRKIESLENAIESTARKFEVAAEKVATRLQSRITGKKRARDTSNDVVASKATEDLSESSTSSGDDTEDTAVMQSFVSGADDEAGNVAINNAEPPADSNPDASAQSPTTETAVVVANDSIVSNQDAQTTETDAKLTETVPSDAKTTDANVASTLASEPPTTVASSSVSEATDSVSSSTEQEPNLEITTSVLNSETPDWVKKGIVTGDTHIVPISSSMFSDIQQCRDDLDSRLVEEVAAYLNDHVLQHRSARRIPELNLAYIKEHLLAPSVEFDNVQNRSSGLYHQLWVKMVLAPETVSSLRAMERPVITAERTEEMGVFGSLIVALTVSVSWGVGLLAKREKAKLSRS